MLYHSTSVQYGSIYGQNTYYITSITHELLKKKTVKLGNQTVMTPQAVDGTGIMIGSEAGLMGVQRELGWGLST